MDRNYLKDELRSILTTTLSFVVVDGMAEVMNIYNGDWSKATLYAFLFVLMRSAVKAILSTFMPQLFPIRKSNPIEIKELPNEI